MKEKQTKNNRTGRELSFKGRKYLQTKPGRTELIQEPWDKLSPWIGDSANLLSDEKVMNN